MKQLEGFAQPRSDRHATALLFDSAECRLVAFTLGAGQVVPAHRSPSTVLVSVVAGAGVFHGERGEMTLQSGDSASYDPNELHGMTAGENGLRFLAVITPRPGAQAK
jgi:quercetin dioxygenase-like cupin family protein